MSPSIAEDGVARHLDFEVGVHQSTSLPSSEAVSNEDTPSLSHDDQNENVSYPPDIGNQPPPPSLSLLTM